jgi:hypothetical protein
MKQSLRVGAATCVLGAIFAACGSNPTINPTGGTNASSGAGGAGGAHPSTGASTASSDIGGGFATSNGSGAGHGSSNGSSGTGGDDTCAGQTTKAQLIPLDIYLMLDSSGSMADTTGPSGSGPSKWSSVTQALSTFFGDPQSTGLGVGLQHFPLIAGGVPAACTSSAQCPGPTGPCLMKICGGMSNIVPCENNGDCAGQGFGQCVTLGQCGSQYCAPANGSVCAINGMPCNPVTDSFCVNQDSCQGADYGTPAVEIAPVDSAGTQLDQAINSWTPSGATPTAPALSGAIDHAKAWAAANPTHTVVVLLATDGLPTECAPQDIPGIAQLASQGASGAPSVKTFAIGVFSPADIGAGAKANLDQIAAAGGTTSAFIVDTSQNVEQQFLDALNAIRGSKLACEYAIPPASPGSGTLDFGKVNVEYTAPGASTAKTIGYAGQAGNCGPTDGGWYYDVDPMTGGTPTKIIMCPATCTTFSSTIGGQIDIRLGCKTVIKPPN